MYKANSFKNNNKQVISGNDKAGPQLLTNAGSITQRIFGSDRLLGTTQLALTSGFHVLYGYKAAFSFGFAFERDWKSKFAFEECEFRPVSYHT